MDGGEVGELEYENFNAAGVKINIAGRNVHPGSAKGKMINALSIAMEIDSMLPKTSRPEYTDKYEGFYHLVELKGEPESAYMEYIVRDHDKVKFEDKKIEIKRVVEHINSRYGQERVKLEVEDQYYNMREKIEPVMEVVEVAKRSMDELGIEAKVKPIRGGTDGARLSYMGLPCPNIFTGGHNFHGRFEYIPIQSMEKAVEVIVRICENYAKL
jgi:tripeptide aminopeptidase